MALLLMAASAMFTFIVGSQSSTGYRLLQGSTTLVLRSGRRCEHVKGLGDSTAPGWSVERISWIRGHPTGASRSAAARGD